MSVYMTHAISTRLVSTLSVLITVIVNVDFLEMEVIALVSKLNVTF